MSKKEDENIKSKQYEIIGKSIVEFEHLMDVFILKLRLIYNFAPNIEIILEELSANQLINVLRKIIKSKKIKCSNEDDMYKLFVKDLDSLNKERNKVVHSTWYIGWKSSKESNLNSKEITRKGKGLNFESKKLEEIECWIKKCESLKLVLQTIWSIDFTKLDIKFNEFWLRDNDGIWSRKVS